VQSQPRTVVMALLPSPMKVGGGRLRPITLGHLLMLHSIKSPFIEDVDAEPSSLETYTAGYILSKKWDDIASEYQDGKLGDNALEWVAHNNIDLEQLDIAIGTQIEKGFESAAQTQMPSADGGALVQSPSPDGNGIGYLLTIVEMLCETYKWTLEHTLDRPVSLVYAFITAHRISEGAEWHELNYFERDRDMGNVKTYLDKMKVE